MKISWMTTTSLQSACSQFSPTLSLVFKKRRSIAIIGRDSWTWGVLGSFSLPLSPFLAGLFTHTHVTFRKDTMEATLVMIREKFGGAEEYVRTYVKLTDDDIAKIRRNLLIKTACLWWIYVHTYSRLWTRCIISACASCAFPKYWLYYFDLSAHWNIPEWIQDETNSRPKE